MSDRENESDKAKELRARIKALDDQEREIRKKRGRLEQKLAEELAKYKVGDRVSYEGKPWVIVRVSYRYGVRYDGRRVKLNGQLYTNTNELWNEKDIEPRTELVENEETLEQREARLKV